uniref:p26-1 n=1 Tax=Perigonia lusca single nucleopolyhedrovirus TaxID=1675865 RepID=A0A0M3WR28_9ABAC
MVNVVTILLMSLTTMLTVTADTHSASPTPQQPESQEVYEVEYSIDEINKRVNVIKHKGSSVHIEVFEPNGVSNGHEYLDTMHHFPGVASTVVFDGAYGGNDAILHVLLNDGTLARFTPSRVYTNFHSHKNRLVYGQMHSFVVDDYELANRIYLGAPIFQNRKLISVVSCRYDEYDDGIAVFPISAVRSAGLVSGQIEYDSRVIVHNFEPGMSVYGKKQLPYESTVPSMLSLKRFAINAHNNRRAYRDLPRAINVFHNRQNIVLTVTEGEFEMSRVRMDGPLVRPQT